MRTWLSEEHLIFALTLCKSIGNKKDSVNIKHWRERAIPLCLYGSRPEMNACRCTSLCSDSESLINMFWEQLHNQFCIPLEVVAALLMGLLCEAKTLLKWTFSVLFFLSNLFTHARFAIGLKIFFSSKSMLSITNVFVISCKKKLKRWQIFARHF